MRSETSWFYSDPIRLYLRKRSIFLEKSSFLNEIKLLFITIIFWWIIRVDAQSRSLIADETTGIKQKPKFLWSRVRIASNCELESLSSLRNSICFEYINYIGLIEHTPNQFLILSFVKFSYWLISWMDVDE